MKIQGLVIKKLI